MFNDYLALDRAVRISYAAAVGLILVAVVAGAAAFIAGRGMIFAASDDLLEAGRFTLMFGVGQLCSLVVISVTAGCAYARISARNRRFARSLIME